jgi:hypothetical protein
VLRNAGIDAILADDGVAALGPQFAPWGIRLQVPEEDAQRALEILDANDGPGEAPPPDATPEEGAPREYEVGSAAPEEIKPNLICPKCAAQWVLTEQEIAQPSFTCTECRTVIPLGASIPPAREGKFDWRCFLPCSDSRWVFVLVMVAYTVLLALAWNNLIQPLLPPFPNVSMTAYQWLDTLQRIGNGAVAWPVIETLLMAGIFEVLRLIGVPAPIRVFIVALALCSVDGHRHWQHGVAVFPGFAIMGFAYEYWRRASWKDAFLAVVALHSIYNGVQYTRLLMNQVHLDITSYQSTGNFFTMDRAGYLYGRALRFYQNGNSAEEIATLQQAIAINPRNPDYYIYLGLAQEAMNQYAAADATLRQAIALDESYWIAWDDLSYVLKDERRFAAARAAARHALSTVPPNRRAEVDSWLKSLAPSVTGTGLP